MMSLRYLVFFSLAFMQIGCGSGTAAKFAAAKAEDQTSDISQLDFLKDYTLTNVNYGSVTIVELKDGKRLMKTNGLPNHATGNFPNPGNPNKISEQDLEYSFPLVPQFLGEPRWAREPGVALNGIKFEPETAERFVCETGEQYRIEAFQDLVDMGLDFNHAHVQPTGAYHYHGVPTGLVDALGNDSDIVLVGFAHDGYPIYYSRSGKYTPSFRLGEELRTGDACSYSNPKNTVEKELNHTNPDGTFVSDWEYEQGLGNLDECNGISLDGEYCYFVTDAYPYMGRCLKGAFTEKRPKGRPPGAHPHRPGSRPHQH